MSKTIRNILLTILLVTLTVVCAYLCACNKIDKNVHEKGENDLYRCAAGHYEVCSKCGEVDRFAAHYSSSYSHNVKCIFCGYEIPTHREIDKNTSKSNVDELKQKLEQFGDALNDSSNLRVALAMCFDDQVVYTTIAVKQQPIYAKVIVGGSITAKPTTIILREEKDEIFSYTKEYSSPNADYYYDRNFVTEAAFDNVSDEVDFGSVDFNLSANNCNAQKDGNTYLISSQIKDMLSLNGIKMLQELCKQFNVNSDKVLNCDLLQTYTFGNKTLRVELIIRTTTSNYLGLTYFFDISDFKIHDDIDSSEVRNSDIFPDAVAVDVTSPVEVPNDDYIIKTNLNKGVYVVVDEYGQSMVGLVYDSHKKEVSQDLFYNKRLDYTTIVIPQDDYYYVTFKYSGTATFTYYNYDDLYDRNNPQIVNDNLSGTIQGEYDLKYYRYASDKEAELLITNNGEKAIRLLYDYKDYKYIPRKTVGQNETYAIHLTKGNNYFYVQCDEETQYNLSTEVYVNNNGASRVLSQMPTITDEFGDTYMTDRSNPDYMGLRYLRLHVDRKAVYSFESSPQKGLTNKFGFVVFTADFREEIYYDSYALEPGDYVVGLGGGRDDLCICQVKCSYVLAEDTDVDITLNTISIADKSSDEAYITSQSIARNQLVRYHFALDEDSVVMYEASICIFDENDRQLSYGKWDTHAIKLKAGDYYFIITESYSYYRMAIVVDYDEAIDYDNMPVLSIDNNLSFVKNDLKVSYFTLQIEKDGTYKFKYTSYCSIYVYDEDLNVTEYYLQIELKAGTYYVYIHSDHDETTLSIAEVAQ